MNRLKLIDRAACGRLSRREFAEALGVFGLVATSTVLPLGSSRADGRDLLYFTFAGFDDPALFPAFVETYGGPPQGSYYGDEYEGMLKLQGGYEVDLICPGVDLMPTWHRHVELAPLDEARLAYLPDMFPTLREMEGTYRDGERFFVPLFWGTSSIIYRPDLTDIAPEDETWQLLFDERYAGRMTIWDSTDAVIPVASLAAGFLDNPYTPSGERLEVVAGLLRRQRDLVRYYWVDTTGLLQGFVSGETPVAFAWSFVRADLKDSGVPFVYATPKEGLIALVNGLAMTATCTEVDAAYDFINASTSPEGGQAMIEELAYGSSNAKAFDRVDPALLADLDLADPEQLMASAHPYQTVPDDLKEEHIRLFEQIKAGD